ncbi:hypothetical protein Bbelb_019210 [Branchiostoma belcheri]|nr:hypothetical protein Bbelb_019210 [Branchiostoma belcheri]
MERSLTAKFRGVLSRRKRPINNIHIDHTHPVPDHVNATRPLVSPVHMIVEQNWTCYGGHSADTQSLHTSKNSSPRVKIQHLSHYLPAEENVNVKLRLHNQAFVHTVRQVIPKKLTARVLCGSCFDFDLPLSIGDQNGASNCLVAVKVVRKIARADLVEEADILSRVCHRSWFPSMFGRNLYVEHPYLVQEFVSYSPGKDVSTTLLDVINEPAALLMNYEYGGALLQVAHELPYLHQAGILHNDLKSDNVMIRKVGAKLAAKIIDFSKACWITRPIQLNIQPGEPVSRHIAHEVAAGKPVSVYSDIVSLGRLVDDVSRSEGVAGHRRKLNMVAKVCLTPDHPGDRMQLGEIVKRLQVP